MKRNFPSFEETYGNGEGKGRGRNSVYLLQALKGALKSK